MRCIGRVQGQTARARNFQLGLGFANCIHGRRRNLTIGHALSVKRIVWMTVFVQCHHRQGRGLRHGCRHGQLNPIVRQSLRQLTTETITGQGVLIQSRHILTAQGTRQIEHSPTQARLKIAIGLGDQIDQGFASSDHTGCDLCIAGLRCLHCHPHILGLARPPSAPQGEQTGYENHGPDDLA